MASAVMAPIINFELPTKSKLPKIIGVLNHQLYVFVNDKKQVEIWCLNLYIPNSWKRKWHFKFDEIAYVTATTMPSESCIYCLFTGCHIGKETYCLDILKLDVNEEEYVVYKSKDGESVFELAELYDIHFETDTLCAGQTNLYIYDRGMVSGTIPFTCFTLDHEEKTFTGTKTPITADDPSVHPAIFGSLICPDQKRFIKLVENNSIRLFDHELNKWVEFTQTRGDSDIYLNEMASRHIGIGITYNQEHTRFAIVSSPFNLIAGDNECILVYKYAKRVLFCRFVFDFENHEFKLKKVGRIQHSITQGYMYCDNHHLIVLSRPSYFITLKLMSLREISFKAAQELAGPSTDDSKIRELCGVKHQNPLI
ncbi:hypothetical protein M3Y97_00909400 [Aphelenchoides bicaudatus]|nr:hypothetical protein M3Y97_00909400 [Aphelenchoides bicaudatus]